MWPFNREKSEEEKRAKGFMDWMWQANKISRDNLTQDEKRVALSEHLDTLDEDMFTEYFPSIMGIIQSTKHNCEPYKNTEAQVDNICSWLTRMNDHREILTLFIRERREKYGLEI